MGRFIRWVENGISRYRIFNDAVRDFYKEPAVPVFRDARPYFIATGTGRHTVLHDPAHDISPDKHMLLDLSSEQYARIPEIKQDWSYVARADRQVDWEVVLPLAKLLFPGLEIVQAQGVPSFLVADYERVLGKERVDTLWNTVLWSVMADVLQRELAPVEYDLYFNRVTATAVDAKRQLCTFAVLDFANRVLGLPEMKAYGPLLLLIRSVGGFHFEGTTQLVLYDYPAHIHLSTDFGAAIPVPHNTEGTAIGYRDGSGFYYIEGFPFEARVVTDKGSITVEEVEKEQNAERRRILTEQMGISRYLHEARAKVIDMDSVRVMTVGDDDRRMPRALIEAKDGRRFLCGTDGSTRRVYYIPVPRDADTCKTAHEAIAGPVGRRRTRTDGFGSLALGLDEKDCIAQS